MGDSSYVNGLFEKTLIIMSEDIYPQVYYPIKNRMEFSVKQDDFKKVQDIIEKFHNKLNIVIDGRLEYIILATHINYPDYCFVYDINNSDSGKIIDAYTYLSSRNNIELRGIMIYNTLGRKIVDLYTFVKYYCKDILWKTSVARDICERSKCLIDILINYIGVKDFIINDKTKKYVEDIRKVVKNNFSEKNVYFDDINILFSALTMIKTTEDTLKNY